MRIFNEFNENELLDFSKKAAELLHSAGSWQVNPENGRMELFHLKQQPFAEDLAGCMLMGSVPDYATGVKGYHSDFPARYTALFEDRLIVDVAPDAPSEDEAVGISLPKAAAGMDDCTVVCEKRSWRYTGQQKSPATMTYVKEYEENATRQAMRVFAEIIRGRYQEAMQEEDLPTEGELAWYVHKSMKTRLPFFLPLMRYHVPRFRNDKTGYDPCMEDEGFVIEGTESSIRLVLKTPNEATIRTIWTFTWEEKPED